MTTEKQRQANRRNAAKSTGPKTAKGKARSSKNATVHGLSVRTDPEDIVAWMRVILEDGSLDDDEALTHPKYRLARQLATAQAKLHIARKLQNEILLDPNVSCAIEPHIEAVEAEFADIFQDVIVNGSHPVLEHQLKHLLKEGNKLRKWLPGFRRRREKWLRQNLSKAEARQERALRQWIEAKEA